MFRASTILLEAAVTRPPRQTFLGEVVGTAMQKTVKVRVARTRIHPIVQKPVVYHKNFLVHDENSQCVIGDWVRIDSCRKLSKRKNFTLGEVVTAATRYTDAEGKVHTQRKHGVEEVDKMEVLRQQKHIS
ncbi:hypothetical protein DFS34DRAFT_604168 [Phlyctochytrium arcticum]|nr:hypothetical protein DFS34DRAFT_604168 [Phlyctochytrium arcticum]